MSARAVVVVSMQGRVANAWLRATTTLGYALSTRDMAERWSEFGEGARPRPMSRCIQSLMRTGVLRRVTGRQGQCRYVHADRADVAIDPLPAEHFTACVLAALSAATTAAGRYVTTREVAAAVRLVGHTDALNKAEQTQVWQLLRAATEARRQCVAPFGVTPGLVVMAVTTRASAVAANRRSVYWWRPVDQCYPAPTDDQPATGREAGTLAAEFTRAALGRPGSADEIALYVAWRKAIDPADILCRVLSEVGLGKALMRARAYVDRSRACAAAGIAGAGLVSLTTPFSAGRLMPPRISLPTVSAAERARAVASDFLLRLQPARELQLLDALTAHTAGNSAMLAPLIHVRRALVQEALASVQPLSEWPAMIEHLRAVRDTIAEWVSVQKSWGRGSGLASRTLRALGPRADDLRALEQILTWPVVTMPACMHELGPIRVVSDATTISFAELEPLQSGLRALQFGRREGVHPIFKRARRVQTATHSRRAVGKGESQSHERLDRVDAYSTAMAYVGAPATGTLVSDAVMLMGTMLRDVRVIDRVLDCAGPSEEWAVRGLLVATGLLGVAPQPARWIPRPECVDAGLLATVVADPTKGREVVRRLAPMMDSGGRHRASVALAQVEAGEWLALVG